MSIRAYAVLLSLFSSQLHYQRSPSHSRFAPSPRLGSGPRRKFRPRFGMMAGTKTLRVTPTNGLTTSSWLIQRAPAFRITWQIYRDSGPRPPNLTSAIRLANRAEGDTSG